MKSYIYNRRSPFTCPVSAHYTYIDNLKGYHCGITYITSYMYGIYINFDNFTFNVNGCISIAKRNSFLGQRDKHWGICFTTYFNFDEVSLKRM